LAAVRFKPIPPHLGRRPNRWWGALKGGQRKRGNGSPMKMDSHGWFTKRTLKEKLGSNPGISCKFPSKLGVKTLVH